MKVTTVRMSDETYDRLHARAAQLTSETGERVPVSLVIRQAIRDYLTSETERQSTNHE